ncbi:IgA FC receptor precursor [Pseudomonas phage crassa]|uniref:IgA FC receptor n=1 Tax=Pseudomonas phage crassa TaxID=2719600 RepID=A0A6G9LQA0_9CAUD|nr:IgA FC receptor precursor [Pseudomonas phage crassa]QIQ67823.1 IgA FC receptor precursor [Pseudomonas phage crassa]
MLYIWEDQDIHHNIETLAFVGESRSNYTIIGFEFGDLFAIAKESTGQIVVSPLTRQGMAEWLTMNGHIPAEIISHGPGNHKNPYVWADSIVLKNLPTHPNMRCVTTPFTGFDPAEPGGDKTAIGQVIKDNRSAEMFDDNPAQQSQRSFGGIAPSLPDLPEPPMAPMAPPGLPVPPAPTAPKAPPAPPAPPAPQVSRQSESLSLRSGAIPSSPATDEDKLGDMQRAPSEDMLGDPFA